MNIILIILVFGVIVFFHEFGHFIVAKINKISVTEFSIGMGPKLFGFKRKETQYSIRLLPLGGYCMMAGENEESDDENSFSNKSVLARIMVVLAGPVFNFILAFIFAIILVHNVGCDPTELTYISENGAAEEAGIKHGDIVKEIDGKKIYNYREVALYMQLYGDGDPVELTMESAETGEEYVVEVTPKPNQDGEYKLGVGRNPLYVETSGFGGDLKYAALECRYWFKATITGLKMIVSGGVSKDDVMGPVGVGKEMNGIIEEVKEVSSSKKEATINILLNMINWCILLSVNLGIMNLLPIPALDGGRLLFLLIEAVTRKKIPADKEAIINFIGFVLLLILMVVVFFNDITNIF